MNLLELRDYNELCGLLSKHPIRRIIEKIRKKKIILDVGCGCSEEFHVNDNRGSVNCDIRLPMRKIENFVLCDCHNLPFRESLFDIVYFYDVIEHIFSPYKTLIEIRRVLKIGGFVELGTPNALYLPKILRSMFKKTYTVFKDHICTWGKTELEQLMFITNLKGKVDYITYLDSVKPLRYSLLVKLCPFKALKHRQLLVKGYKKIKGDD